MLSSSYHLLAVHIIPISKVITAPELLAQLRGQISHFKAQSPVKIIYPNPSIGQIRFKALCCKGLSVFHHPPFI
ncbi:hypothetical protein PXH59_19900, partial (plasmid) [Xenorhabdus sp. SF857]|uniref:hypothetical protein n=1 Tax=Xenorhabdus bakwenae TaxID=3026967 RepID=UPI002557E8CE